MPEADSTSEAKNFYTEIPQQTTGNFHLKGSCALDWGMQNRLSRIFRPTSGHTVMGVTAVGKEMARDARYLRMACPVPIMMAGGKKLPEFDALTMAYRAIQEGAAGVDMGRNIFQRDCPEGMIQVVSKIVYEGMKPDEAFELYSTIRSSTSEPQVVGG